jgi:uncharacterized protein (TIGR02147 family)
LNARPSLFTYSDLNQFVADMLQWKKKSDPSFSLRRATAGLGSCSPALVSLVARKKRNLTLDRVQEFSILLDLTPREKNFLRAEIKGGSASVKSRHKFLPTGKADRKAQKRLRASPSNHIFSHWTHPYVKDVCRLKGFEPNEKTIFKLFRGHLSERSIQLSLAFLLREGYLRRNLAGQVVENDILTESIDEISSKDIRRFHKNALKIAADSLESCPLEQREASTLLLPLNHERFLFLKNLIKEWSEATASLAEEFPMDDERLYQLTINLCPVAGLDLN